MFHQWYAMNKRTGKNCKPPKKPLYYPPPFRGLSAILLKCCGSATSLWNPPCEWENQCIHHKPRPERQHQRRNGEVSYMTMSEFFGSFILLWKCFLYSVAFRNLSYLTKWSVKPDSLLENILCIYFSILCPQIINCLGQRSYLVIMWHVPSIFVKL